MTEIVAFILFFACDGQPKDVSEIVSLSTQTRQTKCPFNYSEDEYQIWAKDFSGVVKPYWITHYTVEKSSRTEPSYEEICLGCQCEKCGKSLPILRLNPEEDIMTGNELDEFDRSRTKREFKHCQDVHHHLGIQIPADDRFKKAVKIAECKVACEGEGK